MIRPDVSAVLRAGRLPPAPVESAGSLLIAGATGALGQAVLRRLGGGRWTDIQVLAVEPIRPLLRAVRIVQVPGGGDLSWPPLRCDVAVALFEPPRAGHQRERALWTPTPAQLPDFARRVRDAGAHTLAVVLPHDTGALPQALRDGLAGLDEQQVAAMGFERLIFLRSARDPGATGPAGTLHRLARWMLGVVRFMVPQAQRPVQARAVAALLDATLELAPEGIHIAAPETVWAASQRDPRAVAAQWLAGRSCGPPTGTSVRDGRHNAG